MENEILTRADVQNILGVSSASFYKYAREHGLPVRRLGKGKTFVLSSELAEWLSKRPKGLSYRGRPSPNPSGKNKAEKQNGK